MTKKRTYTDRKGSRSSTRSSRTSISARHPPNRYSMEGETEYAMKDEVFKAVKPIYEELSSDDLLSRCLDGYTQNNNESFNSVLWSIAPKGVHSSKAIVDIAANIAVCNFNDGLKSVLEIMQVLNLTIGTTCYNFCIETDERRTCRDWFRRFKNNDFELEDKERSGAPKKFQDKELEQLLDITGDRYRLQLVRLSRALKEKRPLYAQRHDKVILLHDNARPHVAKPVKTYLETLKWEVLPHPPYSPDIAPSDFHLF
ncbi:MOS1T transposase, partial [Pseudoatta argentina]